MIAGAFCEETDCTFLVMLLLVSFAAIAIVAGMMATGAFMLVNAILRDRHVARGWRWAIAAAVGAASVLAFWRLTEVRVVGLQLALVTAALVFAAGIVRQSRPCSRA